MQIDIKQDEDIIYMARLRVLNDNMDNILECNAYIGEKGLTYNKVEGDKKTPAGTFKFGVAFGTDENININKSIQYIKLNDNFYWVDDINSKNYNKLVDISKQEKDFESAEHLIDYKVQYKYSIEIKTNPKNIKGKGSAIFLHCTNLKPTAGCVAIKEEDLKKILSVIDSNTTIKIY